MSSSDFTLIAPEHRELLDLVGKLTPVERRATSTVGVFLDSGKFKIITSNGESFADGPVWILWDTSGFPYPITPEEFEKLYTRKESP